jgi:hypothetical protein
MTSPSTTPTNPKDWVDFFEARLSSWTTWVQLAITAASLLPVATLLQSATSGSFGSPVTTLFTAVFLAVAGVMLYFAVVFLRKRRRLLLVMTQVLRGTLASNTAIALAYELVE